MKSALLLDSKKQDNSGLSVGGLLFHAWNILFDKKRGGGRISRGEYVVSYLLLSLLGGALMAIISGAYIGAIPFVNLILPNAVSMMFIWSDMQLFLIMIIGIYAFTLMIKRSHDIQRSWRFPVFPHILLIIFVGFITVVAGGMPDFFFFYALFAVIVFVLVCICFILLFVKGTHGPNVYGEDTLISQPTTNTVYRQTTVSLLCLIFAVFFVLIRVFELPNPFEKPIAETDFSVYRYGVRQDIDENEFYGKYFDTGYTYQLSGNEVIQTR